jgi:hypothetical protein
MLAASATFDSPALAALRAIAMVGSFVEKGFNIDG